MQMENAGRPAPLPATVEPYTISMPEARAADQPSLPVLASFLWRKKLMIAAAAMFGVLMGALASGFMEPTYRARTSLQLEGFNDQALHEITPVSPLIPNASPESYLQNEVKLLESSTLAQRVAGQIKLPPEPAPRSHFPRLMGALGLAPKPATGPAAAEQQRIERVKKALTVRTSLQSQVIELLYDAPDPDLAARGANAAASEFMNLNREARWQLVQDTTEWLNKQAAELKARLESLNAQQQNFARRSGLIIVRNNDTPAQDRMMQIQEAFTRAEADRAAKQSRYETATANQGELMTDALTAGPLRQYQTDLQNMRRQLAELRTLYTPDYYKVTRLEAQIAETEAAIEKERNQSLARMRNEYLAAVSFERALSGSLAAELKTVQSQREKEQHYNVLKNEIDTTQKLYDSVLEKSKAAGAESSLRMTNVRVIDAAVPPSRPYSPNLPLNTAIGLAFGTFGGLGLVLFGARPGKVKQPGELMSMNFRELGVVPSVRGTSTLMLPAGASAKLSTWEDNYPSLFKESFRAVLTSILFSSSTGPRVPSEADQDPGLILVVTSVDMEEGKTTIVTNLGIASAERKQKVLLIDADLRRPRLHEQFHLSNQYGLTDLLKNCDSPATAEDYSLKSVVQPTHIRSLSVLTSGPVDGASEVLLYASDLSALLQRLARQFDLILIDSPPMQLYSDARILGRLSDGVVMVVRAKTRRREDLRAIYQRLMADRIRVLGTILNDWQIDPSQARAYSHYYNHYSQRGMGA
jgi:polysaccharide biosynthesis transport protein